MKHITLTACLLAGLSTNYATASFDLTILHTNDFHARFEPISKYDSGCSAESNAEGKCFGGSARLQTAISEARARAKNSLLVDGGDQFQGTLFYTYYKGKVAAEMMNKMGYDAMTVGNHEFDDGPEVLRGFMDAIDFPILMSNADVTGEPSLNGVLKKSTIIKVAGEPIGLIGLTPEDTHELSSPGDKITFSDPITAVQTEVNRLTAQGVNKIIVLSHSGYEVDKRVAAQTAGVDVIVGGHSNTYLSNTSDRASGPYPTMVGNTAIVQAYAYGKFLGELNLSFDNKGKLTSASGEPLIMDKNVEEDADVVGRIATLAKPLESIRKKVVASVAAPINGERTSCRLQECAMGNLVADAMLNEVASQGVEIAIMNGGGIRASIDEGAVTMGDIYTVLPFQNTLATFKVDGQTVIDALENGVSQMEEGKGRFPQVAGLRFNIDPSVAPNKGRISNVKVNKNGSWQPIDTSATYYLVSNNYVRSGGDGYKMFRTASDIYDFGPDLAEVLNAYLAARPNYQAYVDGRIQVK